MCIDVHPPKTSACLTSPLHDVVTNRFQIPISKGIQHLLSVRNGKYYSAIYLSQNVQNITKYTVF